RPWRARRLRGRWTRDCRGCGRGGGGRRGGTWGENIEATACRRLLDGPNHQSAGHLRHEVRRLGRHHVPRVCDGEHVPHFGRIEEDRGGRPTVPDRIEGRTRIGRVGERRRRRPGPEAALHDERLDAGDVQGADRGG